MAGWAQTCHPYRALCHFVLHVWASGDAQPHNYEDTAALFNAVISGEDILSLMLRLWGLSSKVCLDGHGHMLLQGSQSSRASC